MTPITAERVRYIRYLLADGWTQKRIAAVLGLSISRICHLKRTHIDVKETA